MPKALEELTKEVLELSVQQRLALAKFLIESAEGQGDPDAEAVWEKEIGDRVEAIDEGKVVGTSYEDVIRAVRSRFLP
jgi:putative addiction module component (TIGR02574 family)